MVTRRWSARQALAECGLGQLHVDGALLEHGRALDLDDRPFQLAGIVVDLGGDVADDVFGQGQAAHAGLFLHDGDARLVAGFFDAGDQAPVEAAGEPLFQLGDFAGRAVGADDDLPVLLVQRVEGVEELLLRAVLAGQEMDVVDDEQVRVAVSMAEVARLVALDGGDELVDEGVAGEVKDARFRLGCQHALGDGLEQVRLAQPDAAVDEQRIVAPAGLIGDGDRCRMGELVAGSDDKAVESVIRVERERNVPIHEHAGRGRWLQWKLTESSLPVTACAAAVKGCWHWPWQKLSWAGVPTVT